MTTDLEKHRPEAVDPRSGEVIDLPNAPHENLVEALLILRDHEQRAKEWRTAVEDELVRRRDECSTCKGKGTVVKDGPSDLEYDNQWPCPTCNPRDTVDVDRGFSREWDAEDLIETVSDLVGRGLLSVMDAQGLVKEKKETVVDGKKAAALVGRAEGEALVELRKCFEWKPKGRAKVKITPVSSLEQKT